MRPGALPWLAFLFCCAVWSSTFLFIRIGNDTLPPVWAVTLRLSIAAAALSAIATAIRAPWPRGALLRVSLAFGFLNLGLSMPLLYWGETTVSSGVAAVTYATLPLSTALIASAMGIEPLRRAMLGAALLALAGVALLFSGQWSGGFSAPALLAILVAATLSSYSGVLLKRTPGAHPITMNAIAHGTGAACALLASALLREPRPMPSAAGWVPVLYLAGVGSVGAFVAWAWLVKHWPVSRISFIAVITPVLAVGLGAAVRGERLGPASFAGTAVVIAAVALGVLQHRAAHRA